MSSSINGRHGRDKLFACTGVVLAILITAMLSRIVLLGAGSLGRFLAVNGVNSLSRIMGVLLICFGAQFVINAVRDPAPDVNVWRQ